MTEAQRFFGCGTALVTPFSAGGAVDERALRGLVEWQVGEGIHYLVPCGSTGEAVTMRPEEHRRIVEIVVEQVGGRIPVMAGAGSNDTRKAVETSLTMKAAGATHLLHVSPMYNKPPQRGIIAHFRAIAEAVDLPIVVYNVPGRTASNIEADTTLALAEIPGIIGIKEASGNLDQIRAIISGRPARFSVLSGDDAVTVDVMEAGGDGVISVVSNAAPRAMARLVECCRDGDRAAAAGLHERLAPLMAAAFVESNPIPIKAALAMMGRLENNLRLPLVTLEPRHEQLLRESLQHAGALA
jgi:4-hydroxy-tetrahydrodipicolinate synthase